MFKNIPEEMRSINNWVCWGENKVPINPINGRNAKSNDSTTWSDYETAKKVSKGYKGIGFMIGDTDFIGVDLDDVEEDMKKHLEGDKENIVSEFIDSLQSYTEISPSGKGLHIWVRGNLEIKGNRKGKVEIYNKNSPRYLTITGNQLGGFKEIKQADEKLLYLHSKYIKPKSKPQVIAVKPDTLNLDESKIIELAIKSKSGQKFNDLFTGSWQGNYSSQSEADLAFCNMLAFWTGTDKNTMDSIFRKSGLYRPKWDSRRSNSTYGNYILDKAIADCRETFTPGANDFNIQIGQADSEGVPVVLQYGLFETEKGYRFGTTDKKGEYQVTVISNFYIDIKEMITTDDETLIKANVGNTKYMVEKIFDVKVFDNKNKFLDAISDLNFFYKGNDKDLQEIKYMVSKKHYKKLKGVSYIGFHTIEGKNVFITNTKAINSNLEILEDIVITDNKIAIKSNILEVDPISREELKGISPYLFNFNKLEITSSILGTIAAMMIKGRLKNLNIKTQHLMLFGEAGCGKSETLENIIAPFFSYDSTIISCPGATRFTNIKNISSSNTIPLLLEEYKPSEMNDKTNSMLLGLFRDIYDEHSEQRGNRDQTITDYPLIAPIVAVGEEQIEQTAIVERSTLTAFSKLESEKGNRLQNFLQLKGNAESMQKLGRSILNMALQIPDKELIEMIEKSTQYTDKIFKGRVQQNVINTITGIQLIIKLYQEMGLAVESEINIKISDVIAAINNNAFLENLEGTSSTKTVVDNTLEIISNMAGRNYLQEGIHYTLVNNKEEIALDIKLFFDDITKYKSDFKVETNIVTSQKQFVKMLRSTDYYIDYKTVRYSNSLYVNGIEKSNTESKRSYTLNIKKLVERGLDIDNLLN